MSTPTKNLNSLTKRIKKTVQFQNATEEEILKIADSLYLFSALLYELYTSTNSAKNELRKPN